jgi:O-acetylhomoserine (thiol)-lyase
MRLINIGMKKHSNQNTLKFETLGVHAGNVPDTDTGARTPPIHQAASFVFKSAEHAANLFALNEPGFIYSRLTNPTVSALEAKLAALEGGTGATCTPTGIAANLLAFSAIMNHGDEFVSSCKIYGGTTSQFRDTFKRAFNWKVNFIDPTLENFKRAINEKTKCLFVESISNPEGYVADLEGLAKLAEDAGIPLIVDNTVPTPFLCRPFEFGADVVVHSTTKYLSGQGHALGGAVVDGGKFDWLKHADKFPALGGPDLSYHDRIFAEMFPQNPLAMHNPAVGLRDLGLAQQPMNAWLTMLGIETLALRMERHSFNALKVAEFLQGHPAIAWVNYPGLKNSPHFKNAQKYMRNGMCSSLFTFGVKGGHAVAARVVENAKLFSHVANIGDTRSLIIHPASTTHSELTEQQKINAGALPEAIRVSIGIENIDDIIADLDQALAKASVKAA